MFTGIIEEVGHVVSAQHNAQSMRLTIAGDVIFKDMNIGDSISVNGVCLTVTSFVGKQFVADVMPESVNMTTFPNLVPANRLIWSVLWPRTDGSAVTW